MSPAAGQFIADPEVIACEFGDGSALLDLRSGKYFTTNSVGTFVWNLVGQPLAFDEIKRAVVDAYDVADGQCAGDLKALLDDMVEAKLIRASNVASL